MQFALLAGTYSRVHLLAVTLFAATTMSAYLVRLFLILRKNQIYPRNPRGWRMAFCATLICFSGAWGLLSCYSYISNGFSHWNSLLLTFCILGISFGAIVSLTPQAVVSLLPRFAASGAADSWLTCSWAARATAWLSSIWFAWRSCWRKEDN